MRKTLTTALLVSTLLVPLAPAHAEDFTFVPTTPPAAQPRDCDEKAHRIAAQREADRLSYEAALFEMYSRAVTAETEVARLTARVDRLKARIARLKAKR